ncbi:MAG TPA: hypothetical protein VHW09_22390 [Bryobacteraceae bacterium]|nr:hypothetical protein [Bryobacteraceae bacterium]
MRTLKVSAVASGMGILAWLTGLTGLIRLAHRQVAGVLLTVAA